MTLWTFHLKIKWSFLMSDKLMDIFLDVEEPQAQGPHPSQANEGTSRRVIGRYRLLKSWFP